MHSHWQDRRSHRLHAPAEKDFRCSTAHATLARAHPAPGLQFCLPPSSELPQAAKSDIFAPANDGFIRRKGFQLGPQAESLCHSPTKLMPGIAFSKEALCLLVASCG